MRVQRTWLPHQQTMLARLEWLCSPLILVGDSLREKACLLLSPFRREDLSLQRIGKQSSYFQRHYGDCIFPQSSFWAVLPQMYSMAVRQALRQIKAVHMFPWMSVRGIIRAALCVWQ